jgi:hypothetical protein
VAAEQVGDRVAVAPIGNVGELDAGGLREHLGRDVPDGAGHECVVDLAWIGFAVRDQVAGRAHRQGWMRHQHAQERADRADRREILARVVAGVRIERGVDGKRARVGEQDRVAVGGALGDRAGRDRAAGAAAILDHHLLPERLAHALGDEARERIIAAAGRERHDQRDWTRWIGLCVS